MGSESPLWTGVLVERSSGVLVAGSELPLWTGVVVDVKELLVS